MTYEELAGQIRLKKSFLCVGLDPDIKKIPEHLLQTEDPLFEFCRAIVDATATRCVAYKPNTAFFETEGSAGWDSLCKTASYIREKYPDIFLIADAKRGDIGNTSAMYGRALLDNADFDAVTAAPYMGSDSVKPFLGKPGKWVILLALTSNPGAADFQLARMADGKPLWKKVMETSMDWASENEMMYVAGATKAEYFRQIRETAPRHFLLVPGVGAQGGSLEDVCRYGLNRDCGLLVNSSRGIIYASADRDFASRAEEEAARLQSQMEKILSGAGII